VKFYIDEDISYKVAEILRRQGIDAVSARDVDRLQASDKSQLEFAASQGRALVTRNRDDYIRSTVQFFNDFRKHHGVLIVPYTIPGDGFSPIAGSLADYASKHLKEMEPYTIDFLESLAP